MTQVIVVVIVAAAFVGAAWSIWRDVRKGLNAGGCSGCGCAGQCSRASKAAECSGPPEDDSAE